MAEGGRNPVFSGQFPLIFGASRYWPHL